MLLWFFNWRIKVTPLLGKIHDAVQMLKQNHYILIIEIFINGIPVADHSEMLNIH